MSHKAAKTTIETYLNANYNETAIHWEGVEFSTNGVDEFIAPVLLPVDSSRELFGSQTPYVDSYIFHINVFVRSGSGSGRVLEIVDIIKPLFTEIDTSGYRFDVPDVTNGNLNGDYIQYAITAPFHKYV